VKFLLDQNQSPMLAELLTAVGHDAIHTRDIGLSRAPDVDVLTRAKLDGRVLITADTDFGELLARSGDDAPSVLLLRRHDRRRAEAVAELILANLDAIDSDLSSGALVVFDGDRIRIRTLPINPTQ
jgi:predicted nuclease of predicted toxin-antitoxin system